MSSVLNTVYNNYLTAYTPKPLTQFDTHKRSELRSVYNSIVKMNRDAPWYLPTTSREVQRYAVDIKEGARELRNTIAQLGGLDGSVLFNKRSVYSSDEDVATASYIGPRNSGSDAPAVELEVHSLASSQENLGVFLPNERISLAPDTYSFDVSVNDMNYEFQFTVGETETNRDVQDRLMRLINNSAIGLNAELAEADGRTALRLTSESVGGLAPGKNRLFHISDDRTGKRSGTVEYLGLDYTSREPSNARYSINGEEKSSPSNRIEIGKVFAVQLKGVSEEGKPVQIGLKTDVETLADNVSHLIGGYNDFLRAAASYVDFQAKSRQLVNELKGIAGVYSNSLESMGVTLTEDGSLSVDQDLLRRTATQSEDINETFGSLKNLSGSLIRKSDQIALNPMNYVQKTIVAYKNPGHNFISPYITSAYSGMMFNSYC